jgi:lysophospholipase L1-like esterase
MKMLTAIFFLLTCSSSCSKKEMTHLPSVNTDTMPEVSKKYQWLALGDSYTIGESVALPCNFPNQAAAMMKTDSSAFETRIIARTGWTTDELETGIISANHARPLLSNYEFVSLLIGVNNQYRGRSVENYKTEFEELLKKAIRFAGNRPDRVVVLSIPDWGVTPFAEGRDRTQIAREIDAHNSANKEISLQYNIHYLDITAWTREAAFDLSLLAPDGLHPSAKEYRRWAERIVLFFKSKL